MRNKWSAPLPCCSCVYVLLVGITFVAASSTPSMGATGQFIAHNTPEFVTTAKNLGAKDRSAVLKLSLWLHLRNQSALEALAQDIYDPNSPNYRHWLKASELKAGFAPTDVEVEIVKQFLVEHNLKVGPVGPNNYFVRAEGTVADVEKAFAVHINRFQVGKRVRFANTEDPYIEGPAGALVAAVYGLDDGKYEHHYVQAGGGLHGKGKSANAGSQPVSDGLYYSNDCFPGTTSQSLSWNGGLPTATYTGNAYNVCGYSPQDIYAAYNLTALYNKGFHGEGQTIVIIDWCGSFTIQQDLNVFNSLYSLPPLALNILYVPTQSQCEGIDPEINIDVEWAHAIAPGANIDLVVPPSSSFADVDEATTYAINYGLGNVISGSYGAPEALVSPTVVKQESTIALLAAVSGISTNYSTGDYGDNLEAYGVTTVNAPADSPYATAVGGVSLALNANSTTKFQTGWGTNENGAFWSNWPNPPVEFGFEFGSGGGASAVFAKPSYQKLIAGKGRQLPDISWLADPYTGAEVVLFDGVGETVAVYGGTSLACPMFSALWAIANQEATVPLGQAAPYLYSLPAGAITDVLPYTSTTNLKGTVTNSSGTTNHYSAAQLAVPLGNTKKFYSALLNDLYPGQYYDSWWVLTFGTDSSLVVKPGWDNVTGLGTPNPQAFADAFKP